MEHKLRFGTGGVPLTTPKKSLLNAFPYLKQLGLDHMELEFVQNVYVKPEGAPEVKKLAEEHDVTLSVHGSYYVNLCSDEGEKRGASRGRVASAARIGALCGAKSVTYHSGFLQGKTQEELLPQVIDQTGKILAELQKDNVEINISPELTGKAAQFGDLPTLIALAKALREQGYSHAALCIDFAHNYARHGGKYNTYEEFMQMFEDVEKGLGASALKHLHMHVSAIEYSDKGEKHHLLCLPGNLDAYKDFGVEILGIEDEFKALKETRFLENKFDWRALFKALKAAGVGGYVVCESPILELDALVMKKYYESL